MQSDFVILGLPASGKTTFLAALWHLLGSRELDCRLTLDSYEGDLKYLNQIAEAWRKFEKVPRTSQIGDMDVVIHLSDANEGTSGAAFFPDLAGETFDVQVEERKCRPRFIERANSDAGLLFFINADTKEDSLSILELNERLRGLELVEHCLVPDANAPIEPTLPAVRSEWEPKLIPTQVRIVQLLADLMDVPFEVKPRRAAIMISAWDVVARLGLAPENWLAVHMPLVQQFLESNRDYFEVRIYGLSAQGADLEDEGAVDQMAEMHSSSQRISIVTPDGESHDLTLPLVWLMAER